MKGYITTDLHREPCAFCRANSSYVYQCLGIEILSVRCRKCGASGPSVHVEDATDKDVKEAVRLWNLGTKK